MSKRQGFQFKQFFIEHARCAMKVGTDSIMLGSWAEVRGAKRILDIGTGSGLLAIMLAQKSCAETTLLGIDVDSEAFEQAKMNAHACPWPEKLEFKHLELQSLKPSTKFDIIVSNPPYFDPKIGQLSDGDPQFIAPKRRTARHTSLLSHAALLQGVSALLADSGRFYCVLPTGIANEFCNHAATYNIYCLKRLNVKPTPSAARKLSLLCFTFKATDCELNTITIRDDNGSYTREYKMLCKDYYLKF